MVLDSATWDDEIERWAPGLDATQVSYSSLCVRNPRGRVDRDANGFPIVQLKPELRGPWGSVIADESHYLKGRKTQWTAAFEQLSQEVEQIHLATGTPIPNWAHEAFTTLRLLKPDEAKPGKPLGSYWRWVGEWFDVSQSFYNPNAKTIGGLIPGRTWDDFYRENWGDLMLLRLREDCLDLPPLTVQEWKVKLAGPQKKAYRELKKDFVTWLDSGEEVAAWSSAAQLIKLLQAITGLEVLDRNASAKGSSAKLDALRTILTDRPRPTLVVAHFRASVEACARAAADVDKEALVVHGGTSRGRRRDAVRAFQRGEVPVLCATLDTISEGMTLHQGGADQIVRVERSWRPSRNEQVVRRLHRMGVERPILCIDLVAEDTVDEDVLALLTAKTDEQMKALGLGELRRLVT